MVRKEKKSNKKNKKMLICEICGNVVDKLYTCKSCGVKFCENCGDPERGLCEDCLAAEVNDIEVEEVYY